MKIPEKYQDRIYKIFHDEDGWWCELNEGWCWDDIGLHTIHEDTKAEVLRCIKETKLCTCPDCVNHTGWCPTGGSVEEF